MSYTLRRVIIESPFRGATEELQARNIEYLKRCIRDSIMRGESPYASHGLIPGALNDSIPEERERGIAAGYAWWDAADAIVFYVDLGWSTGMRLAAKRAETEHRSIELRNLPIPDDIPLNDLV